MHHLARDLQAAALRGEHLAPALDNALEHIGAQLRYCDGYARPGGDDVRVATSLASSPTERAAAMRYALTTHREDIRDVVNEIHALLKHLDAQVRQCYGLLGPVEQTVVAVVPLCSQGLSGKDGSLEWGDPTCMMPAVKNGLCTAHYFRYYRHRIAKGVSVDRDFEPAR